MKYYLINILFKFLPLSRFYSFKRLLLIFARVQVGKNVRVMQINIQGVRLQIGDNTFIGDGTTITGGKSIIRIGKNCDISSHVNIVSGTHKLGNLNRSAGDGYSEDITIEDGVWVGFGATILHGVTIGKGSVIAAGALVNKNIPSGVLAAGVPAVIKKQIFIK